jgi:hypothetical protein
MTAGQWILFGTVQAIGIASVVLSNIHTNVVPFVAGYLLLAPGIFFISSKIAGGPFQSAILAVIINALVWYFVMMNVCKGTRDTK